MPARCLPLLALALSLLCGPAAAQAPRPNIIFVLTDDLGWGDLGVFYQNSRNFAVNRNLPAMTTPALDTMAAEGTRMDRHYCPAPVCAPSRASFLLGVHQGHSNVRDNDFDKELANNHTVASVLKQAGYATAAIGKWGLQGGSSFPSHPQNRGFDYFFGYMAHLDAHYHYPKEQGRAFYENFTNVAASLDKCYSTDLAAARAKKWIADHRTANPTQPFFIYLCFAAPHAQLNVPTTAYPAAGGLTGGVQWTGTPGAIINTATGTIDSWIHPDYASATWDHDNNPGTAEQAWPATAKRHATMVRRIDDAMADLIQTLEDLNIDDNTLIVFTSDNGPHNEAGAGGSGIGAQDPRFFRSYGPLDGIKRDVWEGGIRVPTIARWPAAIPAGRVSSHPAQFHDWMNTFAEVAGRPAPFRSDGVSLVPDLTGSGSQREGVVYVEYTNGGATSTPNYTDFDLSHRNVTRGHMQAVFLNGYKGVRYNTTAATTAFRVYDVLNDPQETTNLAGQPGVPSQAEFEARVVQVRRAGGGVSRPYDAAQIPPVSVPETKPGLRYSAYEGTFPWVPDFTGITPAASGETTALDLSPRTRNDNIGLAYEGYLNVPTAGTYTFFLTTDTGAFVRLHDTQLIDADFGYSAGTERSSGTIPLAAGLHPIRIHYRHSTAASHSLTLQWQGPGISKQTIPAGNFLIQGQPEPGPPSANDDATTTPFQTSILIDVLANDTDDGTPAALSISSVGTPTHGTAAIEDGKIRYTPPAGFSGVAVFSYTITDGADSDSATVTVTVQPPAPVALWTTTFTGADGNSRNLIVSPGDPSFTDTLTAAAANLTFQDSTFSGTVFMHSGTMAAGNYYSPRTNVDNPAAASPQNGGWWQSEFRFSGGSQSISLTDIVFRMVWSNSSGNLQPGDSTVRDITLTAESSLDGGTNWSPISPPQTYNLTVNPGTAAEQHQNRTFTFASPLAVDHATQDLWLRLRAENAGATAGAYVNVQSITCLGNITAPPDDYSIWAALYPDTDLSDPAGDADSDGRTNFQEYAFGLDPADGASISPVIAPNRAAGTFTYTRRKPSLTGLIYTCQSSTTLTSWTDFTPVNESSDNGNPVETITVTLPPALLAEPKLFLRVEASTP